MSTDIEDQEDSAEEFEGTTLDFYIDYMTHDVPAEEWKSEAADMVVVTPDGRFDLYTLLMDHCLEDPQLSKWKQAFVWRLIDKYGDDAIVIDRTWVIAEAMSEAITEIISKLEAWDGEAHQDAQREQSPEAYMTCMETRIGEVLGKLLQSVLGT